MSLTQRNAYSEWEPVNFRVLPHREGNQSQTPTSTKPFIYMSAPTLKKSPKAKQDAHHLKCVHFKIRPTCIDFLYIIEEKIEVWMDIGIQKRFWITKKMYCSYHQYLLACSLSMSSICTKLYLRKSLVLSWSGIHITIRTWYNSYQRLWLDQKHTTKI